MGKFYIVVSIKWERYFESRSEGKVWRMGANESTELTLYLPMKIGGT